MDKITRYTDPGGAEYTRGNVMAAARYLGVSASFLNKARLTGDGPTFFKLGSRVVYERKDLDHWLQGRRRTSTSQVSAMKTEAA